MKQDLLQHTSEGRMGEGRMADGQVNGSPMGDAPPGGGQLSGAPGGDDRPLGGPSPMEGRNGRLTKVIGPDGKVISLGDLPPPETKRWVIRRKAEVVAAVRGGLISLDEACQRYTLSVEEFLSWQRAIEAFGLSGLRTTRLQRYRGGGKGENR